jgi:ATP-binding cassette subfamily F protein 3
VLQLKQVSFTRGDKQLLNNADLLIHAGQKVGLIGSNGAGKTSLLSLLLGRYEPDGGEVARPKDLRLAHLQQEITDTAIHALDFVLAGDEDYDRIQTQLQKAEEAEDGMAIAQAHLAFAEIDGYAMPAKASQILDGLGFTQAQLQQPVGAFSGGWQMRLNLARLLMTRADLLLLDEPTNHLDMEAIIWLENWLKASTQTLLIISHDRDFLDHVVTHIAHLYRQQISLYTGDYSGFEKQRAERLALQQAQFEKQQALRAHLQSYVDRFRYKASKARQAQSRIKMLNRMDVLTAIAADSPFRFEFKAAPDAGNPMMTFSHVQLGYGDKIILKGINQAIREGDRIGLIGLNGAGKSTFVKCLAGELAAQEGEIYRSNKLKIGYFTQHQMEALHLDETPMQHLLDLDRRIPESQARAYLGGFGFSGDDVFRAVGNFSGGEKARLALALLIWQAPNLLLLDEPTNHLDLEMREALNLALQTYEGALVLISHDRHLMNCVTNELWLVAEGGVHPYEGDLKDYQVTVEQLKLQNDLKKTRVSSVSSGLSPAASSKNASSIKQCETQLAARCKELHQVELALAEFDELSKLESASLRFRQLSSKHDKLKKDIAELEAKWLSLNETS